MRDLASGGVGDVDAGMLQKQSRRAVEFETRLFVRCLGRNQVRLASGQCGGVLQDGHLRGESYLQLLLIRLQSLPGQIDSGLRRLHCGPILFHIELRVADFDPHLIFKLMLAYLRLAVFELRAHLVRLRETIADGNIQRESHSFIGGS